MCWSRHRMRPPIDCNFSLPGPSAPECICPVVKGAAAAVAWSQLPIDILSQVLRSILTPSFVNARQVCSHWAHVARHEPALEMLLSVNPDDLSIRQTGFAVPFPQQHSGQQFCIRVTTVLSLRMLEAFVKQLQYQSHRRGQCRVTINLYIVQQRSSRLLEDHAQAIASIAARLLQSHGTQIHIYHLQRTLFPKVVQHLQPMLVKA